MAAGAPTLHHMSVSQSMRILWLLEELNIEYQLVLHDRQKNGRAPEDLKKTHPLGKSPQLITADGRVIIESVAIATYLIKTFDTTKRFQGDPTIGNDDIRDEMLCSFANASLSLVMGIETAFDQLVSRSPFFVRPLMGSIRAMVQKNFTNAEFHNFFSYLQDELGEQDYFMGSSPGRADFMLSWPFDTCTQRKYVDLKKYPALERWYERCHAREGWTRAISKGGRYDLTVM